MRVDNYHCYIDREIKKKTIDFRETSAMVTTATEVWARDVFRKRKIRRLFRHAFRRERLLRFNSAEKTVQVYRVYSKSHDLLQ